MPLSNKPSPTKFTVEDSIAPLPVYFLDGGKIVSAPVTGVTVEVDNPLNDSEGREIVKYSVLGYSRLFNSNQIFASPKELGGVLRGGEYVTDTPVMLDEFLSSNGPNDYAYHNFADQDLSEFVNKLTDSYFDGATLAGATLPASMDTKAEFKALVRSYDKDTTTWIDNQPIGI